MALPPRVLALARTLGIAFWTIAAGYGVYWIAVLSWGHGILEGVHQFSKGAFLFLVSSHCAYAEVRDLVPSFELEMSRMHQLGLALLHIAVGGFVTETSSSASAAKQQQVAGQLLANILGYCMFAAGIVLAILKAMLACQPKVRSGNLSPGGDVSFQPQRSGYPAAAVPGSTPQHSFPGREEPREPRERSWEARRSLASPPLLAEEDRFRSEQDAEAARRASLGLCPDVARWQPDNSPFSTPGPTTRRSESLSANPFGSS